MVSGRVVEVATGVLAGILAGTTVVEFDPANIRQGSRVGIS